MNVSDFGGLFASLTGKSEEEITSKLNQIAQDAEENDGDPKEGVAQFLEDAFSAKFRSISEQQLNRGIRESRESLEKKLKTKYEINSSAKGEDLIDQIVEAQRQSAAASASTKLEELSADQLKGLPQVQEMVKPWVSKYEQAQSEFEQFKNDIQSREHSSKVKQAIRNEFLSLNPILPADETKKQKAIEAFVNSFNPSQFAVTETGSIKPLGESGNTLQDDKYNEVRLTDFVRANNYFDVHKADPTKASPQPAPKGAPSQSSGSTQFANRAELHKFMNDPSIPTDKKRAAYEAWNASQTKTQ